MKKVISRPIYHGKFRILLVGLGILISIVLLQLMRDGFASLLLEGNFFEAFFGNQQ